MVKKLRYKFVTVATISAAIMLLVVICLVNVVNLMDINEKTDNMMSFITDNNGVLPKPDKKEKLPHDQKDFSREAMFDTRYFIVYLNENDDILYTDTASIYAATEKMAQEYAMTVLKKGKIKGYIDDYKYLATTLNDKKAIIFLDATREIKMMNSFLYNSSIIFLIATALVAILSYILSPFAIKPIVVAYDKQKRFITDASHEIKTPLTIISANLDIIEMASDENKWIKNSKEQVVRLTGLVNSLVALSRMEEAQILEKSTFSLSELAEMVSESYAAIAISSGKSFVTEIQPEVDFIGDSKSISQLFYIILDNAFKYSQDNGLIKLTLVKKQDKNILTIFNTVSNINVGKHNEYFDRFYRKDEARSNKIGGFGIGLSIARAIVQKHKGKITLKSKDNQSFTAEIIL